MAEDTKKHPAHERLEEFERQLGTQPIKLKELKTAAATLERDLSDNLKFEKAQEAEAAAIRAKLEAVLELVPKGKEAKQIRTNVRNLLGKVEVIEGKPEPTGEGNSDKTDKSTLQKDEKDEGRQSNDKQTVNADEKLAKMAEKIAPQEYKKWCDLFKALHYGDNPGEKNGKFIEEITGITGKDEYKKVKDALRKEGFTEYLNATSAISAIQKISKAEELDEKTLQKTIINIIQKIRGVVEKVKTEIRMSAAQASQSTTKHKSDSRPLSAPFVQPKIEIARLKEKAPANEHSFYDAVEKYTEDKPEARELFMKAVELGNIETSVAWIVTFKKEIAEVIERIKSQPNPEKRMGSLFKAGLEPYKAEIEKTLQNWEEAEFYVTLGLGKINKQMNQVYTILSIDPQTIKDPAKRRYLIDIQKELQTKLDEIRASFPKKDIEQQGLKDKKAKAQEILETLKGIDEEIKYFEKEILGELPSDKQAVYKNEKALVQQVPNNPQNTSTTSPSAPIGPVVPQSNSRPANRNPDEDDGLGELLNETRPGRTPQNTTNRPPNTPNGPEKLSDSVRQMLEKLLPKKALVSNESAVCLAINKLIRESGVPISELQQFLQNPAFLNKTVSDEAKHAIEEEMKLRHADSLDKLQIDLNSDLERIEESLRAHGGRGNNKSADKVEENIEKKSKIKKLLRTLEFMIALEKRTMTYESPREVLALVNFFINKDEPGFTMEGLTRDINNQVEEQKENQYKGWRAGLNKVCFFLRPTMSSTLRAISKDREFKKFGENPGAELEKLEKIAKDPSKLRDWIDALPGGMKENIHTTVPRVIAYMESAIREGKISSMMHTGRSRQLVENLRKLQHENARKEVEDEFRQNTGMTNQEKMLRYVSKLNDADHNVADINLKLIKKNTRNTGLLRGSAILSGTALPWLAPLAAIPTGVLLYSSQRIYKGFSTNNKPAAAKAAARLVTANSLGITGAFIGGLPLMLPLTVLGLASPEIGKFFWKHRKGIGGAVHWGAKHTPIVGRLFK